MGHIMLLTACTLKQFNELPSYRWVSLARYNELKIAGDTIGVKINGECSFRTFRTGKEARVVFGAFLTQLKAVK